MNKYGRTTKMTSPPKGMPAGMAAKYAALEGKIDKVVTMNRSLVEGGGLTSQGYDPNEMVEIKDQKTGKTTKVPYGSYEHQKAIYIPKDQFAKNYDGIGPNDIGVQKFRDNDLINYNANPLNRHYAAGLKTDELRLRKGDTLFTKGASEAKIGGSYQEQFEQPIKGVTDLPSRYAKEQVILQEYGGLKGDLAKMEEDYKQASTPLNIPYKRKLPKLQGKISDLPEETEWEDPTGGKFKRKGAIQKSGKVEAKGPKGAGGGRSASVNLSIFTKKIGPDKGYGILRGPGSGEAKGVRAREEKMAKAFYAPTSKLGHGDYSSIMEGTEGNVSKAIRSKIKDIRQEKKSYIAEKTKGGKAPDAISTEAIGEYNKDIKTARLAARYARRGDLKSLDTDPTNPDAGGVWKAGQKSKLKIYTPEITKSGEAGAMDNYVASAQKNIEAAKLYQQNERTANNNAFYAQNINKEPSKVEGFVKSATDNAANRNTLIAQMEKYKGWGSKIK